MSRSSYTASERRGVLVIAIISLLIIGSGLIISHFYGGYEQEIESPVVTEHPEMIDSLEIKSRESKSTKKKSKKRSTKTKKEYRQRSPLDEPI